jgi:hypothetical protein
MTIRGEAEIFFELVVPVGAEMEVPASGVAGGRHYKFSWSSPLHGPENYVPFHVIDCRESSPYAKIRKFTLFPLLSRKCRILLALMVA